MILEDSKIRELILSETPEWVKNARKYTKKTNVHINGINVAGYLDLVSNFENKDQFTLRKKIAISTKFMMANLLRPVDKVFSAKGGSKIYKIEGDKNKATLDEALGNSAEGLSLSQWIETVQANKYYSDPSGVTIIKWNEDIAYPELRSIEQIRNYEKDGRLVEWILFEPEKRKLQNGEQDPAEYFRLIDEAKDYMIRREGDKIAILEEETYDNPFGRPPVVINSPHLDYTLSYNVSPIDTSLELADHYLRTMSIKDIYEFLHGYPRYWEYTNDCPVCRGTGVYQNEPCRSCRGTGRVLRKDVSDVLALKVPDEGEPKLAPDVAGYVQPDLETWDQQRKELDWLFQLMFYTEWGTSLEKKDNETATGKFIDSQAVNDRLNSFSDSFEDMEKKLTDFLGKYYLDGSYKGSSINYGRRFLVESADAIWERYIKAKNSGAPKQTLDYMLMQYYQAEFQNDIENLAIMQKAIKVEPFIHTSTKEVTSDPFVARQDKIRKVYFGEFWKTLDPDDLLVMDVVKLQKKFDEYITNIKIEENGQNDGQPIPRPGVQ